LPVLSNDNGVLGAIVEPADVAVEKSHGWIVVQRMRAIGRAARFADGHLEQHREVIARLAEEGQAARGRIDAIEGLDARDDAVDPAVARPAPASRSLLQRAPAGGLQMTTSGARPAPRHPPWRDALESADEIRRRGARACSGR
jgi:hypothetical protein